MDSARPQAQSRPLQPGHEVEFFANVLDDCLSAYDSVSIPERREKITRLVDVYLNYALERSSSIARDRTRSRVTTACGDTNMDLDDAVTADGTTDDPGDIQQWKVEAQTWDLLRRLLPLRHPNVRTQVRTNRTPTSRSHGKGRWRDFLLVDDCIKERRAVLQWLQSNAASGPDIDDLVRDLQQNADRGDIIAHGWIHTRSTIKLRKSLTASVNVLDPAATEISETHLSSTGSPLVTQLDPDSVTRQGRKLQPQDEYFERAIWLGCFELLRRGTEMETIRDWCAERTEIWRAVSFSALSLPCQDGAEVEADPASLALWRRMCHSLARNGGSGDYERAVYGILAGDIPTVEKVCKSWDDHLFAHYNALLRSQLDAHILSQCPPEVAANIIQAFASFDAVHYHGDPSTLEKRLLRSLETNPVTRLEARDPHKSLQAAIIGRDLGDHLYNQGLVLALHVNVKTESKLLPSHGISGTNVDHQRFFELTQHRGIRLTAHIYIVMSLLDGLPRETGPVSVASHDSIRQQIQENSLAAYISYLRLAGLPELIPLYCSALGGPRRYEMLCRNLIHTTDQDARLMELNLIRKAGMDVLNFVRTQPALQFESLGDRTETHLALRDFKILETGAATVKYGRPVLADFFGDDPETIDQSHELLIRSVEWLLLVDTAWPEVLSVGTKVYKYFLKYMHLNAARAFATRVPFLEVRRQRSVQMDDESVEAPASDDVDFWTHPLAMMESFQGSPNRVATDARDFRELESLVRALDTMETLASLAELSREDASAKRDFWNKVGAEVKIAKDHIRPVLDSWLLHSIQDGDSELEDLRRAYLPETILAYISTLHFAGTCLSRDNLLECMELAATIAEKDTDIAACFIQVGRMKELVEAFASCSKALAITTAEKKVPGSSSKKLREMGWSRDLWSVKS